MLFLCKNKTKKKVPGWIQYRINKWELSKTLRGSLDILRFFFSLWFVLMAVLTHATLDIALLVSWASRRPRSKTMRVAPLSHVSLARDLWPAGSSDLFKGILTPVIDLAYHPPPTFPPTNPFPSSLKPLLGRPRLLSHLSLSPVSPPDLLPAPLLRGGKKKRGKPTKGRGSLPHRPRHQWGRGGGGTGRGGAKGVKDGMLQWSFLAVQLCRTLASPTQFHLVTFVFRPLWNVSLTRSHTNTHTHSQAKPTRGPPTLDSPIH